MKGVEGSLSKTQRSLKDVERLLKLDPSNTELLAQKQRLLGDAINETKTKLSALKEANKKAAESVKNYDAWEKAYEPIKREIDSTKTKISELKKKMKELEDAGEIDTEEYKKLQTELKESTQELSNLKKQAKETSDEFGNPISTDQYDALQREIIETEQNLKGLEEQAKKASGFSVGLTNFGNAATSASEKTRGLSAAAGGLLGAMAATVPATEELRSDLSKLDNNAQMAGVGIDKARNAFEAFNVVSDETDSSVEATSNLLQAGFTESNLQKAVEGLSGAYLAFPDTMKIESLADSLQETLATGEATGQFGELLDRLGIGAENFSAGLAEMSTEAEKQNYALQTLADAGLMDSYNGWKENNAALVEGKQANLEFQQTTAKLAETIAPLVTKVTEVATKLLEAFTSLPEPIQNTILIVLGATAALSPMLSVVGNLSKLLGNGGLVSAFTKLGGVAKTVLGFLSTGLKALFGIIMANPVVAAITVIIGIIIFLYAKCEWFRDGVHAVIDAVIGFFKNLGENISSIWEGIKSFFSSVWEGIKNIFETALSAIKTVITTYFNAWKTVITTVLNAIKTVITTVWNAIKNTITTVLNGIKNVITTIWNGIKTVITTVVNTIKDGAVNGFKSLVNGIKNTLSKVGSIVKNGFQSAINFIKSLPSKALGWGKDFINGLADGIKSAIGKVTKAVSGVANKIKSFLHFSRPDVGPLHYYEKWMPDMMRGLAGGIYDNMGLIKNAVNAVSETMSSEFSANPQFAVASNPSVNVNNAVTVQVGNEKFKGYIVKTATQGITEAQRSRMISKGAR